MCKSAFKQCGLDLRVGWAENSELLALGLEYWLQLCGPHLGKALRCQLLQKGMTQRLKQASKHQPQEPQTFLPQKLSCHSWAGCALRKAEANLCCEAPGPCCCLHMELTGSHVDLTAFGTGLPCLGSSLQLAAAGGLFCSWLVTDTQHLPAASLSLLQHVPLQGRAGLPLVVLTKPFRCRAATSRAVAPHSV